MPDRYAVVGNPIAHSKSPQIHAAFARATGQDLSYERLLAPLDGFDATVERVRARGRHGPATSRCRSSTKRSPSRVGERPRARARRRGQHAERDGDGRGTRDNTDGAGIVRDLTANLGVALARPRRSLILGAGGAARGIAGAAARAGAALASRWPTARWRAPTRSSALFAHARHGRSRVAPRRARRRASTSSSTRRRWA